MDLLDLPDVRDLCRALHPHTTDTRGASDDTLAFVRAPGAIRRLAGLAFTASTIPRLAGLVERAGLVADLADDDRAVLLTARTWALGKVAVIRDILAPVGAACAREGLAPLLVKGTALHGVVYPDPADRPCGDVDVLLAAADAPRFHAILVKAGFHPHERTALLAASWPAHAPPSWLDLTYHPPLRQHVLEVKADPICMGPPVRRLADLTRSGPPSPCYPGFHLPHPDVSVLQQALHLARRPAPNLRAHADLAGLLVARHAELDPDRALDLLRGEGLVGIVRRVLADTERVFPGCVPAAWRRRHGRPAGFVPRRIRRGTLRPSPEFTRLGLLALFVPAALGNGRPLATARWLWSKFWPPEPLRSHLTASSESPGIPALRPFRRLLGRFVRRSPP